VRPTYIKDKDDLRRHIYYDTMLGLISGLAYIHREIDGEVGYHRDLKPSNILLFEKPKWVWKICDFGCSNLKPAGQTGTSNFVSTRYYAPPEFSVDRDRAGCETHGRAHDVFSLGCVFLELATILKHGWILAGLEEFRKQRAESKLECASRWRYN